MEGKFMKLEIKSQNCFCPSDFYNNLEAPNLESVGCLFCQYLR